jgi:hypothetical protein
MNPWLDRLREEIEESTRGLSDSEWKLAPKGRWSSAEILEHLGRTYGTTAKMLELSMNGGNGPQDRTAKVPELLLKILIVDLGIFPSGAKSPALVTPKGDAGPVALKRALSNLDRMDIAITEADKRWGDGNPIAMHPLLGPLSAGQWRKFHYLHGHHHVRQIWKRLGRERAA